MSTSIRYLLFDLGGTLMHSRSDLQPIHKQADEALAASLLQSRIELDPKLFRARLSQYYEQRDKDVYETTYHLVLSELLTELNHAEVPEGEHAEHDEVRVTGDPVGEVDHLLEHPGHVERALQARDEVHDRAGIEPADRHVRPQRRRRTRRCF